MMKFPIIQKNNSSFLTNGEFRRTKLQPVNEPNMMKEETNTELFQNETE